MQLERTGCSSPVSSHKICCFYITIRGRFETGSRSSIKWSRHRTWSSRGEQREQAVEKCGDWRAGASYWYEVHRGIQKSHFSWRYANVTAYNTVSFHRMFLVLFVSLTCNHNNLFYRLLCWKECHHRVCSVFPTRQRLWQLQLCNGKPLFVSEVSLQGHLDITPICGC